MTIYSWNMLYRNKRLREALEFVRESGADIFCLQEVPETLLPRLKELPYHFAAIKEVDFIARGFSSTSYIVILSRYPITRHESIALPLPSRVPLLSRFFYAVGLWALARSERHVCMADLDTPAGPLRIFNLHLSLTHPKRRMRELELALAARDSTIPSIVCGDLNTLEKPHINILNWLLGGTARDMLSWRRERTHIEKRFASYELANALRGRRTHPLSRSQLDHILTSPHFTIKNAHVLPGRYGSDHHPIRIELAVH